MSAGVAPSQMRSNAQQYKQLWSSIESKLDQCLPNWEERIKSLKQVSAVEDRKEGKRWTNDQIFRGIVLALLSNATDWARVESVEAELNQLFHGFDVGWYAGISEQYVAGEIVRCFKEHRAGSQYLKIGLTRLITTAKMLCCKGCLEDYFANIYQESGNDCKQMALLLGTKPPYKLYGFGIPLAAEMLKNIGYDVAKPDRHVNRAVVAFGLLDRVSSSNPRDLVAVMTAVETLASAVGKPVCFLDNAIWLLGSKSGAQLPDEKLGALAPPKGS